MSRLYLITGFLGSGKSTFLKNFIRLFPGEKMQLIINEFGREGIDGMLLEELGIGMEEITGGSVFCSCRLDQFEQALTTFVEPDTDVVLVEASGLSDPTGVRRLFADQSRFPDIEYAGAVCLVDAVRFPKVYAKSRACLRQVSASDIALINKSDLASPEQLESTRELIRGHRPDMPVLETSFGQVDSSLPDLLCSLQKTADGADREMPLIADITTMRLSVRVNPQITVYQLRKFIEMFSETTFRVKGFVQTKEGMMLVSCTGNVVSVSAWERPVPVHLQGLLTVLSGSGMPVRKRVREAAAWYPDEIGEITLG